MENTSNRWQRLALSLGRPVVTLNRVGARLLCALTLVTGVALHAQSGTGSITGRVLNLGNSKYVGNAVVTVEGTGIETLTGEYGEYRLNGVPAGDVQVK